jgi:hypothetical protein
MKGLIAALTFGIGLGLATSASAVSLTPTQQTFSTGFALTEQDLEVPDAGFSLPKADPSRKLVAAELQVAYRVETFLSFTYESKFGAGCADHPHDPEDSVIVIDGYCFYKDGYEDWYGEVGYYFDIWDLKDEAWVDLYYNVYYIGLNGPNYSCIEETYDEDTGEITQTVDGQCVEDYWDISFDDLVEGDSGPIALETLSLLKGPGSYLFPFDGWSSGLAPTAQITGTASITYSYAPVPLPAGLPLALAGLAALALVRNRTGSRARG